MDQRDRTAPIALTRDTPIAQPIDCGGLAATQRFEPLGCGPSRLGDGEAVEKGGIEDRAVLDKGCFPDREARGVFAWRQHHRDYWEPIFSGEFEVALVVGRTAEDGAGAVLHQHEIGDEDRHPTGLVERMHRLEPGRKAALFRCLDDRFAGAQAIAFGDEGCEVGVALSQTQCQRMVWRYREKRSPVERILPRREDLDALALAHKVEKDARALRAPDPVFLHQADAVGPAFEAADRFEELFGERGDAQKPLRQQPFFDDRPRAPAASVDHLLIGQNGVLDRVPIDP